MADEQASAAPSAVVWAERIATIVAGVTALSAGVMVFFGHLDYFMSSKPVVVHSINETVSLSAMKEELAFHYFTLFNPGPAEISDAVLQVEVSGEYHSFTSSSRPIVAHERNSASRMLEVRPNDTGKLLGGQGVSIGVVAAKGTRVQAKGFCNDTPLKVEDVRSENDYYRAGLIATTRTLIALFCLLAVASVVIFLPWFSRRSKALEHRKAQPQIIVIPQGRDPVVPDTVNKVLNKSGKTDESESNELIRAVEEALLHLRSTIKQPPQN